MLIRSGSAIAASVLRRNGVFYSFQHSDPSLFCDYAVSTSPNSPTCVSSSSSSYISSSSINTQFVACFNELSRYYYHSKSGNRNREPISVQKKKLERTIHGMLNTEEGTPYVEKFNTVLASVVRMRDFSRVFSLIKLMESLHVMPNVFTLTILINCFCHLERVDLAFALLAKIFKLGFEPTEITFITLVKTFDGPGKTAVLALYFSQLVRNGYRPDVFSSYGKVINVLSRERENGTALMLLREMDGKGCKPCVVTYNIIIDSLCTGGLVTEARDIFLEMIGNGVSPDVITYNSLIHGTFKVGNWKEATRLLNEMKEKKIKLDLYNINVLVDALCKGMMVAEEAMVLFKVIEDCGSSLDVWNYNILIHGMCSIGKVETAKEIFHHLSAKKLRPNRRTYKIMVNGLCNQGLLNEANDLLQEMEEGNCSPDGFTYNIIIQGLLRNNSSLKAKQLIHAMIERGFSADAATVTSLLDMLSIDETSHFLI